MESPFATVSETDLMPVLQQSADNNRKFGTFGGIFTPTLLTVLGAIMYLRTGWVVGNAGLGYALLIVVLANVITISTGLSIASVATNIRVRAGGAFSIISQSLGLEVGGSVSVPFYFAQAISVAFYVFAFTEGWLRIFPDHPEMAVVFGCFAVAFILAFISANLAVRAQYLIMTILALSLVSVFLGSFRINDQPGMTQQPELWGSFESGNFWLLFSIFFPAVTGILAGVNMSGDLKDPRRSIPWGTMAAILVSFVIYVALTYWFSRMATPRDLIDNQLIIVDIAFNRELVLAGILAATFSSALTSLLGAPRILQAVAEHHILPNSDRLANLTPAGEPRNAMLVTGVIAIAALGFGLTGGGLDTIAPLMTMFFLSTYSVLNGVVLFEQSLGLISFRPLFRVPIVVPFIGLSGCIFAMFLINPVFSLVAMVVILLLYLYLSRRQLLAPWSDVRSGLFVTLAEWAAKRVSGMPPVQERAWKPNMLVPATSTDELLGSYRFLRSLAYPRGSIHVVGMYYPGKKELVADLPEAVETFTQDGVFSRVALLEVEDFERGLRISIELLHSVFFRPNAMFMAITEKTEQEKLQALLDRAKRNEVGTILYMHNPVISLGREQVINIWIRDQSPAWEISLRLTNLDLSLLLAYQVCRNWDGQINLITVINDPAEEENGRRFLSNLIDWGRMPRNTRGIVAVSKFNDYLPTAPRADLNMFGLQEQVDLAFIRRMVDSTRSTCIFVRDSGNESALA